MAPCALGDRRFCGGLRIWQWMMPKSEEPPVVRLSETLAVFHCDVDAVVFAVEISPSGWFSTGTVRKRGIKDPSEFFYNDRPFGKGARLQVRIDVLLFYVDMMILREIRFSVVEGVGRQRSTHKDPRTISGRQLQLAIGSENCRGVLRLS